MGHTPMKPTVPITFTEFSFNSLYSKHHVSNSSEIFTPSSTFSYIIVPTFYSFTHQTQRAWLPYTRPGLNIGDAEISKWWILSLGAPSHSPEDFLDRSNSSLLTTGICTQEAGCIFSWLSILKWCRGHSSERCSVGMWMDAAGTTCSLAESGKVVMNQAGPAQSKWGTVRGGNSCCSAPAKCCWVRTWASSCHSLQFFIQ